MSKFFSRPMVLYASLPALGAYAVLTAPGVWKLIFVLCAFLLSAALLFCGKLLRGDAYLLAMITALSFAVPFVNYYNTEHAALRLCDMLDGTTVNQSGEVLSVSRSGGYLSLKLRVRAINGVALKRTVKAGCSVFTEDQIRQGDYFETAAVLERPPHATDGFDTAAYLRSQGIFLILADAKDIKTAPNDHSVIVNIKRYIGATIKKNVKNGFDYSMAPLALGLLLGEKGELSHDLKNDFRRGGISHILAVSGLHLAILMAFLNQLFSRLRFPKKLSTVLLMLFCLFNIAVSGFTPSVCRAGIMLMIYYFGFYLRRSPDALSALFTAMAVLCLVSPYSVFDLGAQLSFLATLGILVCLPLCAERKKRAIKLKPLVPAAEALFITLCAAVFTLPVCADAYGEISLVTLPCNLAVIPPVTVALVLIYLMIGVSLLPFFSFLTSFLGFAVACVLELPVRCARFFSSFQWAVIPSFRAGVVLNVFLGVIVLFFLLLLASDMPFRWKYSAPFFLLTAVFISTSLVFGIYEGSHYRIRYYSSAKSEAISIKLQNKGYLFINVDGEFITSADMPVYDSYYGKNHFLVLFGERGNPAEISETISRFHQSAGISKLYLPRGDDRSARLLTYLKDDFEPVFYQGELFFDEARIVITNGFVSGGQYTLIRADIPRHRFAFLLSPRYDRSLFGEEPYDSAVYSPLSGAYLSAEQAPPDTEHFYTRERKTGTVRDIAGENSVNVIPIA